MKTVLNNRPTPNTVVIQRFLKKPYPYREGLQSIIAEVGKVVPSAASLKYEDVADPSIIEKLDKSGYIDGLYR